MARAKATVLTGRIGPEMADPRAGSGMLPVCSPAMMAVRLPLWVGVAALTATAGCSVKDPLYCQTDADCADNAGLSYCDTTGQYEANHIANTCIASPFDAMPPPPPDARADYTISVDFAGNGSGQVISLPAGVQCTTDCVVSLKAGSTLQVFGTGNAQSVFAGFSGDCTEKSCSLVMDRDYRLTAVFTATACEAGKTTCDNGTNVLTVCDDTGSVATSATCTLGCHPSIERCNDIAPSNGLGAALDIYDALPMNQKVDLTLPDGTVIDTTEQTIRTSDGATVSATTLTRGQPGGAPEIFVVIARSIDVRSITVKGSRALALVSAGDLTVNGVLSADASGDGLFNYWDGPGLMLGCEGTGATGNRGGGGGGHGVAGALGGLAPTNASGAQVDVGGVPLRGGCRGGAGLSGHGGLAGGAVQLVSRQRIIVGSSATISANALGGGGKPWGLGCSPPASTDCGYAGGGGAGGTILMEAPIVSTGGSAILAANGGGGGAAGGAGSPGSRGVVPAPGAISGFGDGGNGGAGATAPTAGQADNSYSGGGGGAYGRIQINTNLTYVPGTTTLSPTPATGQVKKR